MLGKYEETEDNHEISSIVGDHLEYKSSTQAVHKVHDSFDSSFFIRNESDLSFISQTSVDEGFNANPKLNTYQLPKRNMQKPPQANSGILRPASILKTTFLSEDAMNYNLPKKYSGVNEKKKNQILTEISTFSVSEQSFPIEKSINDIKYTDENQKGYENSEQSAKICELENQILKKDALIETLRTRVSKMVQELEETHRRVSAAKYNINDDNNAKIQQLIHKCEEYEAQIYQYQIKEKEITQVLSKKEQEINCIDRETKLRKNETDFMTEKIQKLEIELKKTEDNKRKNKNFEDELERSSIRLVLQWSKAL